MSGRRRSASKRAREEAGAGAGVSSAAPQTSGKSVSEPLPAAANAGRGGRLSVLEGLPSFNPTALSRVAAGQVTKPAMVAPPMYIAAHDTDPPEGQVIGTEATNLLLRLFHNKKESARRSTAAKRDGSPVPAPGGAEGGRPAKQSRRDPS